MPIKVTAYALFDDEKITNLERKILELYNFTLSKEHGIPNGIYIYSDDLNANDLSDIITPENNLDDVQLYSLDSVYYSKDENGVLIDPISNPPTYQEIFSKLVARGAAMDFEGHRTEFVEIEGADLAERNMRNGALRPGEFGGFAILVTADHVIESDTKKILADAHKQLKAISKESAEEHTHEGLLQDPAGENTDFVLSRQGGYAWISVGNKSIYIQSTGDDLSVGVFNKGKEAEEPFEEIWLPDAYAPVSDDDSGMSMG